ncbi:MAG: tripartite tricarboxylate transporter permease [Candidatus Aenigmatarchaeota archaeon]
MIEIILFAVAGCALGVLTGLIPGLHVNTITLLLTGFAVVGNPYNIVIVIIAMAITHTIFDFVPSVFLGAPEADTALSVLPGHMLLLTGRGIHAIYLTVMGGVGGMLLTLILFFPMLVIIPFIYQNIQNYIHIILIGIVVVMVFTERGTKKLCALLIFFLSGILGMLTLNAYILPLHIVLFPVFTGLFGMSALVISANKKPNIPKQNTRLPRIKNKIIISGVVKGVFSGMFLGVLPGVGAAQATVLTQQITRKNNIQEFLISIGTINTVVALFSLISLYTISRARSGAAVAVENLIEVFGFTDLLILLGVALFATGISSLLLMKILNPMVKVLEKINYSKMTKSIIVFLVIMTLVLAGPIGLLVLFVSTAIGILPIVYGVKRSMSMGVLMLPLIMFYSGIFI